MIALAGCSSTGSDTAQVSAASSDSADPTAAGEPTATTQPAAPQTTAAPEEPATVEPAPTPEWVAATPADPRPFSEPELIPQELSVGVQSPLVRELQVRLRQARYLAIVDVTDMFGEQTRAAVVNFQRDNGLPTTGIVGQLTWDALLPKSYQPTDAELTNTDVGPWFTGPMHPGFIMEVQHRLTQVGIYHGPVNGEFDRAAPLTLRLHHPTRAELDQTLALAATETGWRADATLAADHDWRVQLTPADGKAWRLRGRIPHGQRAAQLQPALDDAQP